MGDVREEVASNCQHDQLELVIEAYKNSSWFWSEPSVAHHSCLATGDDEESEEACKALRFFPIVVVRGG